MTDNKITMEYPLTTLSNTLSEYLSTKGQDAILQVLIDELTKDNGYLESNFAKRIVEEDRCNDEVLCNIDDENISYYVTSVLKNAQNIKDIVSVTDYEEPKYITKPDLKTVTFSVDFEIDIDKLQDKVFEIIHEERSKNHKYKEEANDFFKALNFNFSSAYVNFNNCDYRNLETEKVFGVELCLNSEETTKFYKDFWDFDVKDWTEEYLSVEISKTEDKYTYKIVADGENFARTDITEKITNEQTKDFLNRLFEETKQIFEEKNDLVYGDTATIDDFWYITIVNDEVADWEYQEKGNIERE